MFRRREPDVAVDRIVDEVERAKEELVAAVPSPRGVPGRPIAEAILAFEEALKRASDLLASDDALDPALRTSFGSAVAESLHQAERVRLEAPPLDYETLVTVLGDLIAPLDAFRAVEHPRRR
jgi:hypothetical protein